jgi:hypothetical protein
MSNVRTQTLTMLDLNATKFKLAEAHFFYAKLCGVGSRVVVQRPEEFHFYLSAFLSAGRSVTLVLQAEHKAKYDAWFPDWKAALPMDQAALLVNFNEQRVATIHLKSARVIQGEEMISGAEYLAAASLEGADIEISGPPGVPLPTFRKVVRSFSFDGAQSEVLQSAGQYLALVQRLVADFEGRYALPVSDRADR